MSEAMTLEAGAPDSRSGRGLTKTLSLPGFWLGARYTRRWFEIMYHDDWLPTDDVRLKELEEIETHVIERKPLAESVDFRAWWGRRATRPT